MRRLPGKLVKSMRVVKMSSKSRPVWEKNYSIPLGRGILAESIHIGFRRYNAPVDLYLDASEVAYENVFSAFIYKGGRRFVHITIRWG